MLSTKAGINICGFNSRNIPHANRTRLTVLPRSYGRTLAMNSTLVLNDHMTMVSPETLFILDDYRTVNKVK